MYIFCSPILISDREFEIFHSEKDRSILGRSAGIFGYKKQKLQEIGLEEILTEDGVVKARKAAIRRIKDNYPASKLELWRKVYWLVKNTH